MLLVISLEFARNVASVTEYLEGAMNASERERHDELMDVFRKWRAADGPDDDGEPPARKVSYQEADSEEVFARARAASPDTLMRSSSPAAIQA